MYDNLSCVHKDNNTATEQVKAPVKAPKNCVVGTCCWLRNMLSNRERFQCIWMYMAVGVVMCCLNCIWCPNLFHLFVPYGPCFCIFLVHEVYLCICNLFDLWLMMVSCRAYFHPPKNILYFQFVCLAHFLPVLRHLFYRSHDINRNNKTCNIFTIYKFANFAVKLHNMIQQGQVCSTIPPISFMNSFELCCMHSVKTIDYGWQKTCWNRWLLQCTDSDMESVRCSGLDTLFPWNEFSGALRWRVENCWVSICLDPSF